MLTVPVIERGVCIRRQLAADKLLHQGMQIIAPGAHALDERMGQQQGEIAQGAVGDGVGGGAVKATAKSGETREDLLLRWAEQPPRVLKQVVQCLVAAHIVLRLGRRHGNCGQGMANFRNGKVLDPTGGQFNAQRQAAYLRGQTSMSTITVSIDEIPAKATKKHEDSTGFIAGLSAGWDALAAFAVALATAFGAVLPWLVVLLVLGLPAWLVGRRLRRRVSAGRTGRTPSAA